jgi:hypothetical protein
MDSVSSLVYSLRVRPEPISVEHLSGTPLFNRLMAVSANIRQGWKGLPGTNTLAYYKKWTKKAHKTGPGVNTIKDLGGNFLPGIVS